MKTLSRQLIRIIVNFKYAKGRIFRKETNKSSVIIK